MATNPRGQAETAATRPIDLAGDSPELVAFALLRQVAQLEQQAGNQPRFDRTWLLDAYAECLEAVRGNRVSNGSEKATGKPRGR